MPPGNDDGYRVSGIRKNKVAVFHYFNHKEHEVGAHAVRPYKNFLAVKNPVLGTRSAWERGRLRPPTLKRNKLVLQRLRA